MHIIIIVISYMHNALSSHFDDGHHKAKPAMCICIQTQIIYMHIFRGEPRHMYEDNTHNTKLSHTFIPVENFDQFVINHQKGGDCKCI